MRRKARFLIQTEVLCMVEDEGVNQAEAKYGDNGYGWNEHSYCRCPDCGHEGVVLDFDKEK